jgi:hypothetical protein
MRKTTFLKFAGFGVFLLLSSCLRSEESINIVASQSEQHQLPTPTAISTLITSETEPPAPTMTYWPTLPVSKAEAEVIDLLKSNGGCRLPCFWGFTPSKTQNQEFVSKLYQFNSIRESSVIQFSENGTDVTIHLSIKASDQPKEKIDHVRVIYGAYQDYPKGEYQINPYYGPSFYPSLPSLLREYGRPQGIYGMLDLGKSQGMEDLFLLFLDNTELGWVAIYLMPAVCDEDTCRGCPARASVILDLWVPGNNEKAIEYGFAGGAGNTLPIHEATPHSLEDFYLNFLDPEPEDCITIFKDAFYY